jgi:thiol-disulfide isomerase/thioredoxin
LAAGVAKADLAKECFTTDTNGQFCTTDNIGKVQVWSFNAGWCPGCNEEMEELPAVSKKFAGQDVVFASLSGEGYSRGSRPDATFLKAWRSQHKIPFVVAGKYRSFGDQFGAQGYIPFNVIVDKAGNIVESGSLSADTIETRVKALLGN